MASNQDTTAADKAILFQHPAYGWFWCARVFSALAFQILAVVVGWQIYELTQSTFQLGMVGLVQFLPIVVFTLISGHVADRYDRRMVYGISLATQGVATCILALGTYEHWLSVSGIYVIVGLVGTARAFQGPATQALLPTLVPEALVPRAIAWSTGAFQTASIVGPAIGGLLYVFGPAVPYGVATILTLAGSSFMFLVRQERAGRPKQPATVSSMFSGFHYIWTHPIILGSISLDLFAVLLGGATALLPVFAKDILHIGTVGLGMLRSAPAVGSLAMSVYLARNPPNTKVGRKMFVAVFIFGVTTVVFGLSRSFTLSLITLGVMGAADTISVVIRSSMVQIETPNEMRGRVGAVNSLFIGTSNQLGEFESGLTASWFGTVWATVIGGVGTLVVAGLWMRFFPTLTNFNSFEEERKKRS
ncbi:MAG TPA: MFS transporter [Opitutaceae bacterium]|jgi:MFS family permease|nr:MFS transporter [Opitutaceae bacterium]